jgi:hypothetical protein
MPLLQQILPAAVIALMVSAGVCAGALYWGKERARGALGPLAIGLAYLSGHLVITGLVPFPPRDTTNWLPYFALAGAVLGAFVPEGRASARPGREESRPSETRAWVHWLLFVLLSGAALKLLLKPKFQYSWSLGQGWIWVVCLGGAMLFLAIILDALARRHATATEMPAFLLLTCAGTFGALMLSGSMLLGQFAAVLGAAVLGSLVFTARKVAFGRRIVPVFSLLMSTLLMSAYFFAELPLTSAALLAFAPVLALVPIGVPSKLLAFGIRSAFVAVPILVALVLAFRSSPPLSY